MEDKLHKLLTKLYSGSYKVVILISFICLTLIGFLVCFSMLYTIIFIPVITLIFCLIYLLSYKSILRMIKNREYEVISQKVISKKRHTLNSPNYTTDYRYPMLFVFFLVETLDDNGKKQIYSVSGNIFSRVNKDDYIYIVKPKNKQLEFNFIYAVTENNELII